MCGIFAYVGNKNIAQDIVLQGLKNLEYRGYDSWGIAIKKDGKTWVKKDIGKIGEVTSKKFPKSSFGIGHTRWATHGGVTKKNSHPHSSCGGDITLVHNGIIENYQQIKDSLENDHTFISETDTEILVHLIEEEFEKTKNFKSSVVSSFKKAAGLSAVIAFYKKEDQFIVIRRGSPLVIGYGEDENYIASDPAALLPYTKKMYFLEDDQGVVVSKSQVQVFDFNTGRNMQIAPQIINWQQKQASRGDYEHFMLKEIHEQLKVVGKILSEVEHSKLENIIRDAHDVWIMGSGTASYAARIGSLMLSQYLQIISQSVVGSEYQSIHPVLSKKSLLIALSQSGETMDILEAISQAKKKGVKITSLVNVEGSTLYRESDFAIPLQAGPEKAVASTKAFIAKLAHFYRLTHPKNQAMDKKIVSSIKKQLSQKYIQKIKKIAYILSGYQNLYILGKGLHHPIAMEAALKIKEISYIHTEGFAAGELKHGVIALIEKGTPCVLFIPNDKHQQDNLTAASQLKARGAQIIGVSTENHPIFDHHILISDLGELSIFQSTIVGQLLAYYLAVEKNLDPDMPRNLAKSVTVK